MKTIQKHESIKSLDAMAFSCTNFNLQQIWKWSCSVRSTVGTTQPSTGSEIFLWLLRLCYFNTTTAYTRLLFCRRECYYTQLTRHFNHCNFPEVQWWKYMRLDTKFKITSCHLLLIYWFLLPQELQNLLRVPFQSSSFVKNTGNAWHLTTRLLYCTWFPWRSKTSRFFRLSRFEIFFILQDFNYDIIIFRIRLKVLLIFHLIQHLAICSCLPRVTE